MGLAKSKILVNDVFTLCQLAQREGKDSRQSKLVLTLLKMTQNDLTMNMPNTSSLYAKRYWTHWNAYGFLMTKKDKIGVINLHTQPSGMFLQMASPLLYIT